MRRLPSVSDRQILGFGWSLAGVLLTAGGALAADLAVAHMRATGLICGASSSPHCGWCFGAASLVLAGLAAFACAAASRRAPAREGASAL